ncbi:MAG: hypothetical protein ACFFBD_29785 [Candidatus Hodarchaeota archaeon]
MSKKRSPRRHGRSNDQAWLKKRVVTKRTHNIPDWAQELTPQEYTQLQKAIRQCRTKYGMTIRVEAEGGVVVDDRMGFPVEMLLEFCQQFPGREWVDAIAAFVNRVNTMMDKYRQNCPECQGH